MLFKPCWINAQPSFVYQLGLYLNKKHGYVTEFIKYIELVGELVTQDIKKQIEELFPYSIVVSMYGMQEFNGIMYQNNNLMQSIEENVYVELINNWGEPCDYEEEGRIVVTGLKNSVFPLVRYDTGDRGKRVKTNKTEGYIITRGRCNDSLFYDGRLFDGSLFFTVINLYNRQSDSKINQFQVVLENESLTFYLFSIDKLPSEDETELHIEKILNDIANIKLPIRVVYNNSMNDFIINSRKIKYFINKDNCG